MKKNILLTAAMAFMAVAVFAQEPAGPPPGTKSEQGRPHLTPQERAKQATDRLNALVTLTPDQYTKVLDANTTFNSQREALRANGAQPGDDMRAKMKALGAERDAKLKTILTAEQWKKREDAHKAQMNDRGGSFKPGEE